MSLITLEDGRFVSGVIMASDERTVTLKTLKDEIALEKDAIIKNIQLQDSVMPQGLLSALAPEKIRDLIAYLMHPQQVPLPDGRD